MKFKDEDAKYELSIIMDLCGKGELEKMKNSFLIITGSMAAMKMAGEKASEVLKGLRLDEGELKDMTQGLQAVQMAFLNQGLTPTMRSLKMARNSFILLRQSGKEYKDITEEVAKSTIDFQDSQVAKIGDVEFSYGGLEQRAATAMDIMTMGNAKYTYSLDQLGRALEKYDFTPTTPSGQALDWGREENRADALIQLQQHLGMGTPIEQAADNFARIDQSLQDVASTTTSNVNPALKSFEAQLKEIGDENGAMATIVSKATEAKETFESIDINKWNSEQVENIANLTSPLETSLLSLADAQKAFNKELGWFNDEFDSTVFSVLGTRVGKAGHDLKDMLSIYGSVGA